MFLSPVFAPSVRQLFAFRQELHLGKGIEDSGGLSSRQWLTDPAREVERLRAGRNDSKAVDVIYQHFKTQADIGYALGFVDDQKLLTFCELLERFQIFGAKKILDAQFFAPMKAILEACPPKVLPDQRGLADLSRAVDNQNLVRL